MIIRLIEEATQDDFIALENHLKSKSQSITINPIFREKIMIVKGPTFLLDIEEIKQKAYVKYVFKEENPYFLVSRENKKEDTIISIKGVSIGGPSFTVIAGPCSVESYEQLDIIAKEVNASGANILRGGCFKPRTSPYSFQGLGVEGLKMMKEIGEKYDLPIVTEIPSEEYIALFEKYVDIIQVGARNMQNYSLLKALGKQKKPILLKRGFNATLEELLLSAEYIAKAGNDQIILCERGIRTFETSSRNTLDIQGVLALKELTHLPVIVDPSHSSGHYKMVRPLSMASYVVGASGLMIEVHNEPAEAFSDGQESLNIKHFAELMKELSIYQKLKK